MPDTSTPRRAAADLDDEIPQHPARPEIEAMAADERLSPETRAQARALLAKLTRLEVLGEAMRIRRRRDHERP